ncbi:uncharacterized protein PG998_009386 [Apiospora kogelbergensis]|uniref:Uncharacterized protein n=1 Tax=Apiospora kogelbergensis TaxID=1337665 RepID=A0AAW0R7I4_9PEZI
MASEPSKATLSTLSAWGTHSMAPTGLATLITALHWRPLQKAPMAFVPVLLFASYINLQGFKKDSAGMTAAASGTYALLALRRKPGAFFKRFGVRGAVRGSAIALGLMNLAGCGWVYATADRKAEEEERKNNPRWG